MSSPTHQPLLHRIAVATAIVALLPITVGAIVTTMNWGMAFLDYPTSDGHNMFLYPWLKSAGDQFAEHGHRLAGMLIGFVSVGLMIVALVKERRTWVKVAATIIPFCVLFQGLLGGARVLANDERMAMFHGSFAAVVFTLMAAVALWTGRWWKETAPSPTDSSAARGLRPIAFALPAIILGQYLLGGFLRHLGMMMYEHVGMATVVLVFVGVTVVQAVHSGIPAIARSGMVMAILVLLQVGLGIGSFLTKFGFAPLDIVAVQHAPAQVVFRTSHTVIGMLLLTSSVLHALRIGRISAASPMMATTSLSSTRGGFAEMSGGLR